MNESATTISNTTSGTAPTLFRTMLRPRWLLALVLALGVAAGFAWLGRWQLERAVRSDVSAQMATETVVRLTSVAKPGGGIRDSAIGQKVRVSGSFNPHDYQLIAERMNSGKSGYWVVGHFTLGEPDASGAPVALAVARGWAPSKERAERAVRRLAAEPASAVAITGRLLPTEAPEAPDPHGDPRKMTTMSVAALYNLWTDVDNTDVYSPYVVQFDPPAGLAAINAPPPIPPTTLNWLNLFYAIEWAVFAGFAVYMWYRVVKDAFQRATEEAEQGAFTEDAGFPAGERPPGKT